MAKEKTIYPVRDNLLVKKISGQESLAKGKVYNSDSDVENLCRAEVIFPSEYAVIASDGTVLKSGIKTGDIVLFDEARGVEIMVEGIPYLIIKESFILVKQ